MSYITNLHCHKYTIATVQMTIKPLNLGFGLLVRINLTTKVCSVCIPITMGLNGTEEYTLLQYIIHQKRYIDL